MTSARELVDRTWAAVESGRIDDLEDLFCPDADFSVASSCGTGLRHIKAVFARHHEGYPDLRHDVVDAIEAPDGQAVALRLAFAASHTRELRGPFGPIAPTGRILCWTSADHVRARNGRIVSWHAHFDRLSLLGQLGQTDGLAAAGTNRAVARRVLCEVFEQGRTEVLPQLVTADFVNHRTPAGVDGGVEGLSAIVRALRSRFPDLTYTVEREITEGDWIAQVAWAEGTHEGWIHGFPATGRRVCWRQVHVLRMEDCRVAEHWGVSDLASVLEQVAPR
ncbi:MAG TPA: ester cyclase family protein [Terriglobales bacterium]|nr:ester cyclase family protein [Terriglobales bacterium]